MWCTEELVGLVFAQLWVHSSIAHYTLAHSSIDLVKMARKQDGGSIQLISIYTNFAMQHANASIHKY